MNFAVIQLTAFRQMVASDLQGGTVTYAGADIPAIPATVGTFRVQELLTEGGLTPTLIGDVQVATADIGAIVFKSGQKITVTPKLGAARSCKIVEVVPTGALIHLTVSDVNQGV